MRIFLIVAALLIGLAGPAQATTHRGLPEVMRPAAANLFPEGVAWDPSRRALLVGSLTTPARISAVGRDGVARTVVSDPDLPGFLGLEVDRARDRIVAVYGAGGEPGPTGLAVYDLTTGARERLVDLSGETHAANDVALDPRGVAYVTDAAAAAVYRVDLDGRVSTLVSDPRLGPAIGANGILWHPGGYVLVANYTTGRLYRLTGALDSRDGNVGLARGGRLDEVWTPRPLVGADGLALRPNGTLVVVTNALAGLPDSRAAVHELVLAAGGRFAVPYRVTAWPDPAPTTVAVTPYGDYVLDGRIDALMAGGDATDFVLRRI